MCRCRVVCESTRVADDARDSLSTAGPPARFPRGVFQTTTSRTDDHRHPSNTNFHNQHQTHHHLATNHREEKKKDRRKTTHLDPTRPTRPRSTTNPHKARCLAARKSPSQSATSPSPTSSTSKCGRRTSATGSESRNSPSQSSSQEPESAAPLTRIRRKPARLLRN